MTYLFFPLVIPAVKNRKVSLQGTLSLQRQSRGINIDWRHEFLVFSRDGFNLGPRNAKETISGQEYLQLVGFCFSVLLMRDFSLTYGR